MPHDTPSRRPPAPFESTASGETPIDVLTSPPREAFLFEVAWEVCNQVGGIYQVLRSKAELLVERWHEEYCLIGPYVEGKARLEFEPTPRTGFIGRIADELSARGIIVHHGRWLIPGKPRVLLLANPMTASQLAEAKYHLWKHHHIETPGDEPLIDGAIAFGEAVTTLLELAANDPGDASGKTRQVISHFHEWQGGLAMPMLRRRNIKVGSVFTTHATMLGRYIASNEDGFYERLPFIDNNEKAAHYNVRAQHAIERAAAHGAHVFTTVSQITAEECTSLLGRTPDVITPNGLNIARYNVGHDFQTFHADFKERLHQFTMGHFFPSYSFDLDKTLYMFTSGRFEPHNKGFDLCLETMARLNLEIRAQRARHHHRVLHRHLAPHPLHPPARAREARRAQRAARGVRQHRRSCRRPAVPLRGRGQDAQPRRAWSTSTGSCAFGARRPPSAQRAAARRHAHPRGRRDRPGAGTTAQAGAVQPRATTRSRSSTTPSSSSPENPLWGIEYDQFVRGCHLGLFPSAYEPWGYTPLECMALGTPAISSDLAGFGRYVHDTDPTTRSVGPRGPAAPRPRASTTPPPTSPSACSAYCRLTRRDRVDLRNEVEKTLVGLRLAAARRRLPHGPRPGARAQPRRLSRATGT